MAPPYRGHVVAQRGRWRVELPGAIAMLSAIVFLLALERRVRDVVPVLPWAALAVALAFAVLSWRVYRGLRWEVIADARGVRLVDRSGATRDLGIPRGIDRGRAVLLRGRRPTARAQLAWVSIVATTGEERGAAFVFVRPTGALDPAPSDWPEAAPPRGARIWASASFDPVAFEAAVRAASSLAATSGDRSAEPRGV